MNKLLPITLFAAFIFVSGFSQASELTVTEAWVREAPPVSKVQAAYMELHNESDKDISIISANSPYFSRIEFHRSEMSNGVIRMLQEATLNIPAKNKINLQPDGAHMMLFNPNRPLKAGDEIPFTLIFSDQKKIEIMVMVKKAMGTNQNNHRCGHHK